MAFVANLLGAVLSFTCIPASTKGASARGQAAPSGESPPGTVLPRLLGLGLGQGSLGQELLGPLSRQRGDRGPRQWQGHEGAPEVPGVSTEGRVLRRQRGRARSGVSPGAEARAPRWGGDPQGIPAQPLGGSTETDRWVCPVTESTSGTQSAPPPPPWEPSRDPRPRAAAGAGECGVGTGQGARPAECRAGSDGRGRESRQSRVQPRSAGRPVARPPRDRPTGLSRPRAGRARCLGDQVRASLSERGHCAFWAPPGTRGSPVRGGRGARPGGGASRPGSCSLSRRERPQGRTRESSCRDGCWGRRQGLPHLVGLRGLSGCPRRPPDRRV